MRKAADTEFFPPPVSLESLESLLSLSSLFRHAAS